MHSSNIEKLRNINLYDNALLSKLQKYFYRFGLRGGLINLFKRALIKIPNPIINFREIVLIEKVLVHEMKEILPKIDVKIEVLPLQHLEQLKEISDYPYSELERRMQEGETCFVGRYKGKICFYVWVAFGERIERYRSKDIPIKENEAYIHNGKTLSSYRGNNIAPYAYCFIHNYLRKQGYQRLIGFIHRDNFASIRSTQKAGFIIYGGVRFIKTFFMKREMCCDITVK